MASRRTADLVALGAFFAACFGVAAIGGAVTGGAVDTWYRTLEKPAFNPPDGVFAPVWTVLYAMMAVAGWRVWRSRRAPGRRGALGLFALQLGLNFTWSALFFGLHWIGVALVEIAVLLLAIVATTRAFLRIDRAAGLLLVPYALWVAFATVLNAAIWALN